jgi:hypothetical protein
MFVRLGDKTLQGLTQRPLFDLVRSIDFSVQFEAGRRRGGGLSPLPEGILM